MGLEIEISVNDNRIDYVSLQDNSKRLRYLPELAEGLEDPVLWVLNRQLVDALSRISQNIISDVQDIAIRQILVLPNIKISTIDYEKGDVDVIKVSSIIRAFNKSKNIYQLYASDEEFKLYSITLGVHNVINYGNCLYYEYIRTAFGDINRKSIGPSIKYEEPYIPFEPQINTEKYGQIYDFFNYKFYIGSNTDLFYRFAKSYYSDAIFKYISGEYNKDLFLDAFQKYKSDETKNSIQKALLKSFLRNSILTKLANKYFNTSFKNTETSRTLQETLGDKYEDLLKYYKQIKQQYMDPVNQCKHTKITEKWFIGLEKDKLEDIMALMGDKIDNMYMCSLCNLFLVCEHHIYASNNADNLGSIVEKYGINSGKYIHCKYCNLSICISPDYYILPLNFDMDIVSTDEDKAIYIGINQALELCSTIVEREKYVINPYITKFIYQVKELITKKIVNKQTPIVYFQYYVFLCSLMFIGYINDKLKYVNITIGTAGNTITNIRNITVLYWNTKLAINIEDDIKFAGYCIKTYSSNIDIENVQINLIDYCNSTPIFQIWATIGFILKFKPINGINSYFNSKITKIDSKIFNNLMVYTNATEYLKEFLYFLKGEAMIFPKYNIKVKKLPFSYVRFYKKLKHIPLDVRSIYGENGKEHKYDTYVFESGMLKTGELNTKLLNYPKEQLLDIYSSITDTFFSKRFSLDMEKVLHAIKQKGMRKLKSIVNEYSSKKIPDFTELEYDIDEITIKKINKLNPILLCNTEGLKNLDDDIIIQPITSKLDPRIYRLDSYIRRVICIYNKIINYQIYDPIINEIFIKLKLGEDESYKYISGLKKLNVREYYSYKALSNDNPQAFYSKSLEFLYKILLEIPIDILPFIIADINRSETLYMQPDFTKIMIEIGPDLGPEDLFDNIENYLNPNDIILGNYKDPYIYDEDWKNNIKYNTGVERHEFKED